MLSKEGSRIEFLTLTQRDASNAPESYAVVLPSKPLAVEIVRDENANRVKFASSPEGSKPVLEAVYSQVIAALYRQNAALAQRTFGGYAAAVLDLRDVEPAKRPGFESLQQDVESELSELLKNCNITLTLKPFSDLEAVLLSRLGDADLQPVLYSEPSTSGSRAYTVSEAVKILGLPHKERQKIYDELGNKVRKGKTGLNLIKGMQSEPGTDYFEPGEPGLKYMLTQDGFDKIKAFFARQA